MNGETKTDEPERLSPEWHARECEEWAAYTLLSDQAATAGVNSKSAILASEACIDRAAKLRQGARDAEIVALISQLADPETQSLELYGANPSFESTGPGYVVAVLSMDDSRKEYGGRNLLEALRKAKEGTDGE